MAGSHIRKKPDGKRKGPGKLTDDFDKDHEPYEHDAGDATWHSFWNKGPAISHQAMLGHPGPLGQDKDHDGKRSCHIDVGGSGEPYLWDGDESKKVTIEDEKEKRGDERKPSHPVLTQDLMDQALFCKIDQRLHQVL